jgi:predicted AlkP superfamily pyrophosphatase or phosphodiesterase
MAHRLTVLTRRRFVLGLLSTAVGAWFLSATIWPAAARVPASTVILISFDGWRWDYLDRYEAPHLRALAARGVRAEGLIPAFPSVTYPNHYTLVTGLYPDHHGVVANSMVDPAIGADRFTMSSATARDPSWWGGEPIWTTVIKRGGRSASMFWPGSEANPPTYWLPYDGAMPNSARVARVLEWLRLPDAARPSFVTLYFSDVDSAGHRYGPMPRRPLPRSRASTRCSVSWSTASVRSECSSAPPWW